MWPVSFTVFLHGHRLIFALWISTSRRVFFTPTFRTGSGLPWLFSRNFWTQKFIEKGQGNPVRNVRIKKTRPLVLRKRAKIKRSVSFLEIKAVCVCYCSIQFPTQFSHFVDRAGRQTKMASIEFWIPWHNMHSHHCSWLTLEVCVTNERILTPNLIQNEDFIQAHDEERGSRESCYIIVNPHRNKFKASFYATDLFFFIRLLFSNNLTSLPAFVFHGLPSLNYLWVLKEVYLLGF